MSVLWTGALICGGAFLLFLGAEALVRGAVDLARRLNVSAKVIGLTVVAYGTSAPELYVSVTSALEGRNDISLGNIVGSNIFNIAVILGLAALVRPLLAKWKIIKIDIPIMIAIAVLISVILYNGTFSRMEAAILLAVFVAYTVSCFKLDTDDGDTEGLPDSPPMPYSRIAFFVVGGLVLLVAGSDFLVDGSVGLAQRLGISEVIIGLTIIAAGTSFPELATSLVAARKGEADIAIANVVGSNIFNVVCILGVTGVIQPMQNYGIKTGDLVLMCILSIILLPISLTGQTINRWEGAFLVSIFVAYTAYLYGVAT